MPHITRIGDFLCTPDSWPSISIIESESITSYRGDNPGKTVDLIVTSVDLALESSEIDGILRASVLYPTARIVVFGDRSESKTVIGYLKAGISGYLSSEVEPEELAKCIEEVREGKKYISQEVLWTLLDLYRGRVNGKAVLTTHEYKIARYLVEGKKTSWIATELSRKASTVSKIKARIFKKLRVNDIFQLRARM
ncbi:hypothetical protein GCM10007423_53520 [Dyadobacter endophyticus]|uniref:HTH luxR-type domain-containing protein n=1 Tax=Dyadobacter endophyticus TaxID=1749036 RepID=A0ABQ1Z7T8_9BACT|nr:hypothetical protein GCM10007423_53520 [Dyadobacter endophyticus]